MKEEPTTYTNLRKGPDFVIKTVDSLSIALWIFFIVIAAVILCAKPEKEGFFDRFFDVKVRDYWDFSLLKSALILSLTQFTISVISLFLNFKRLKRKNDRVRTTIVISLLTSLALCVLMSLVIFM